MVLFIVEMDIYPCSWFFLWWSDKENINLPKQKKNVNSHTKDKEKMAKCTIIRIIRMQWFLLVQYIKPWRILTSNLSATKSMYWLISLEFIPTRSHGRASHTNSLSISINQLWTKITKDTFMAIICTLDDKSDRFQERYSDWSGALITSSSDNCMSK